jgi:putative Mg2+ transporter-C (MgtC) family protein
MTNFVDIISTDGIFVARLAMALVLGGLIGIERQSHGRPAGLRTNILVCLGSAAVVVAFQKFYLVTTPDVQSAIRMDPARAAAGVITGIGVLGAGTIVKSKDFVRGLTTAASVWVVSVVGVTVGLGEYTIAIALTLLVLLTLFLLHLIPIGADQYGRLHLTWHGEPDLVQEVLEQLSQEEIQVKHRAITRQPNTGECHVVLNLRFRGVGCDSATFGRLQVDSRFDEVSWS